MAYNVIKTAICDYCNKEITTNTPVVDLSDYGYVLHLVCFKFEMTLTDFFKLIFNSEIHKRVGIIINGEFERVDNYKSLLEE